MKKIKYIFLVLIFTFILSGCSRVVAVEKILATEEVDGVDVDLTELTSTMVYAEVFNIITNPDDYMGKTIKMNGKFTIATDTQTGQIYYKCVIADATSCCLEGLEFAWLGEHNYPEDFPAIGSDITVVGTFDSYEENGYTYYYLVSDNVTFE